MTEMNPTISKWLAKLEEACEGIYYPSETDSPLQPFYWAFCCREIDTSLLLDHLGKTPGIPVREITPEQFFHPLVHLRAHAGEWERKRRRSSKRLWRMLNKELSDITVFRIGATLIDVYLVGRRKDNSLAGLHTRLVET